MNRITKPMLAETCKNFAALRFPLLATPKLDGIRCIVKDGKALSRKFKEIPNRYIQGLVSQLPDGLDGELMLRDEKATFQAVSSAVMSEDGEPDFVYCVFDYCPSALTERYAARMELLRALDLPPFVMKILPATIANQKDLEHFEAACLSGGFEGVMVRDPHGPYKCGRSTEKEQWLLKIKRFNDAEAEVIGFEERLHNTNEATIDELGHTKRSSHKANLVGTRTLGSLQVRDLKTGVAFSIGTGFDDALRQEIWNRRDFYLGKLVKYKSQPTGVKEAPRFPVFLGFRDARDL
jgi:DNA ligase-1